MSRPLPNESVVELEAPQRFDLQLYIAGTTPRSAAALANLTAICDERLPGRYDLIVVDVYQQSSRAKADQIVAVPTLVKRSPAPFRKLIGDLSSRANVLRGLDLPPDGAAD
jgi:circadian clock protein KaiB